MKKKNILTASHFLIALLILAFPHTVTAGMRDSTLSADYSTDTTNDLYTDSNGSWHSGDIDEADCRFCHENIERFTLLQDTNTDKHHLLVGSLIESPVIAPGGVAGDTYQCVSCHPFTWSDTLSTYTVQLIRDCLICHPEETVTGKPSSDNLHHSTETFEQNRCSFCHSNWSR